MEIYTIMTRRGVFRHITYHKSEADTYEKEGFIISVKNLSGLEKQRHELMKDFTWICDEIRYKLPVKYSGFKIGVANFEVLDRDRESKSIDVIASLPDGGFVGRQRFSNKYSAIPEHRKWEWEPHVPYCEMSNSAVSQAKQILQTQFSILPLWGNNVELV